MPEIHWPNDTEHMLELGRTGSGKTVAGIWHLSGRDFERKPWVLFDTKGDENIEKISRMDGVRVLKLTDSVNSAGIYIVRPRPNVDDSATDAFLYRIHSRGNCGLYFDEGYMVAKSDGLNTLLTQGRSLRTPIILLSQRPAWLTRFAFTEASFIQVFSLTHRDDRKRVQMIIPEDKANLEKPLPAFHSLWYDVKRNEAFNLAPVPPSDEILLTIRTRLQPRRLAI